MFLKSFRFIILIIAILCVFVSCNKEKDAVSQNGEPSKELKDFREYVYKTRMKLLYEHTYDSANIPVADSIYREATRLNCDWCKLRALELKYYVYVASNPPKEKEFLEAIDEFLKIASSSDEYKQELYDGTYAKVEYLIGLKRYISAQEITGNMMKKAETSKDDEGLYLCNYLMGTIYQNRGDYAMAIPYLKKAEKYAVNDSMHTSLVSRELSVSYLNTKRYDEAIVAARRCFNYANNRVYKVWGEYTYLGALYGSGKKEEFVKAYQNSTLMHEDVGSLLPDYFQLELKSRLAACRGDWDEAIAIASQMSHDLFRENELFNIYYHKGDYKKAYEQQVKMDAINDSVRSEMQTFDLHEMEERLANSQYKIESDQLKLENQRYMFAGVIVILTIIIVSVAMTAVTYVRRKAARSKRKAMEERELFYRNVTHQLRTPMTVVLGMVEQLKQHIPEEDVVGRESLEVAHRQSDNLLELIKKLIAASKDGVLVEMTDLFPSQNANTTAVQPTRPLPVGTVAPHVANAVSASSILVAEDNDDVALLICNMLRDKGYVVNRAVDGQEALEMLQEELPDMLITDIAMPRMDGLELMRRVRDDDTMCCLPIVVVSARVEDHERLDGISAGAEVYLAKPFINEELLLIVNKLLEQRKRLKQMFTNSKSDAETSRQVPEVDVEFFNEINKLIDSNLVSGDVSTSFLAEKLCTSVSTLNRRLKNMSGLTSTTYIRNRRILMAKRLLETTDQTIGEIEVLCGFNTSGHFSRVFKAETGFSPLDYRHHNRRSEG